MIFTIRVNEFNYMIKEVTAMYKSINILPEYPSFSWTKSMIAISIIIVELPP